MNIKSASPAEPRARTLVWDLPTRVFHWLLAASFAVAWLSAESERWQLVHVTAGYTVAGLVAFRLFWGLAGTRHARFGDFVRGPRAVLEYLRSLLRGHPERHAGHNPAGALAIVGLLGLAALTTATGWANLNDLGGHWLEETHEVLAASMLALVLAHIAAVIVSSRLHRENLVAAMVHGRKAVPAAEGIRSAWRSVGVLMLVAALGFWWLQWQSAPPAAATPSVAKHAGEDDD